jgi:hypothetical protein
VVDKNPFEGLALNVPEQRDASGHTYTRTRLTLSGFRPLTNLREDFETEAFGKSILGPLKNSGFFSLHGISTISDSGPPANHHLPALFNHPTRHLAHDDFHHREVF